MKNLSCFDKLIFNLSFIIIACLGSLTLMSHVLSIVIK